MRSGLHVRQVPRHAEALGQSNVIVVTADGSITASDPRSDGAAAVVNYPRHRGQ